MADALVRLLKLPPEPPAPFGEEKSLLVFRAAPNFFKYRVVTWAIGAGTSLLAVGLFTVGMAAAAAAAKDKALAVIVVVGLLIFALVSVSVLFSFLVLRLDYQMRWYKVTDRSLRIREGVWSVREMTMTFANIQNIEITQGPIQRMLGIADLKVQTAGGGGVVAGPHGHQQPMFNMHVGYFRGVDNPEEIMTMMRERLKKYRSSGLGDHDDSPDPAPVPSSPRAAAPELAEAVRNLLGEARAFRAAAETAARRFPA